MRLIANGQCQDRTGDSDDVVQYIFLSPRLCGITTNISQSEVTGRALAALQRSPGTIVPVFA
jgi:hypothetical protein